MNARGRGRWPVASGQCRLPLACCLLLAACCLFAAPADNPVLAIAGSDTLLRNELEIQLKLQNVGDLSPENVQPMLEHWVERTLLYREALRQNLGTDETTRALIDESNRQCLITQMTRRITDSIRANDNEIYDAYNRHRLDFTARLRFQFMVLEDEKTAKQTVADLARGQDFVTLAQARSLYRAKAPSAETLIIGRNDTLLGLDPLFEDSIYSLPEKKVSSPIRVGNAWWLVKPIERTHAGVTPQLDQVRDYLSRLIELKHRRAALEQAIAALEKKARIVRTAPKRDTTGFLASVGTATLTRHYLSLQMPDKTQLNDKDLPQLIDVWTRSEVLNQEARRLNLGLDDTTCVLLKEKERDYIADLLVQRVVNRITVPGPEVFDYFQQHRDEYLYNVRVIHILLGSESLAQAVLTEVRKGADFPTLARERSYDRHVAQGAESRFLGRLDPDLGLDAALEGIIFSMKPGDVSPVIHTREGYWLVKVTDRRQVMNDVKFEQAQQRIHDFLYTWKSQQVLNDVLEKLRQATPIRLFPENFWS